MEGDRSCAPSLSEARYSGLAFGLSLGALVASSGKTSTGVSDR